MATAQSKWGGVGLLNPALNILAQLYGGVNVLGLIAPQGITFNGIKNISKEDLKNLDYDLILVAGQHSLLVPILNEAENLGIDEDKIVLDRIVCIPLFTLEKYKKLRHSQLSIFSINCCGGYTYHRFSLQFNSPTINMFFNESGFLPFLKNPIENLSKKVVFLRNEIEPHLKTTYPVLSLGDKIELHMNHYPDAETAINIWQKRSARVNFFNSLAMMMTDKKEILEDFDKLPYAKKVCFVPFETNLDSGFYINPKQYPEEPFWRIVNLTAIGAIINYDFWDMLLYGKKTPLIFKNK